MVKVGENHSAEFAQTCSTNKMVERYFDRLPCEILHNIALMLPFDSIIQLRCSSKFWYNLLIDPKFVDLHLAHAVQKPPGYLFTAFPEFRSGKKPCYFVKQSGGNLSTSKIFEYSFHDGEFEMWSSFQSSGGLMCAYSSQSNGFRIFNPHIGEEIQILRDPKFKRWQFQRFVFSYSPSIKEYKILKLGVLYCGSPVAEIYTLGSNIWRNVPNVPDPDDFYHIHGYIHCQGNPFWMQHSYLHYFDLVSEKFHVIPGPPVFNRANVTHDSDTWATWEKRAREKHMNSSLISMGHTVGYVDNKKLWVLEDKTKGIWINRYEFSVSHLHDNYPTVIGTAENGHLFGYMGSRRTYVFSHDIGCTGFRVTEIKFVDHGREEDWETIRYLAPHVRSFVSPIRIIKMGKNLNEKRKRVFDTLKLDYDATEDDLVNKMYEFLQTHEKSEDM